MQNIIFLDIDGVLNNHYYRWNYGTLNPDCVNCLYNILQDTNAKIVISSSWRVPFITVNSFKENFKTELDRVAPKLSASIVDSIIDMTPICDDGNRGKEVNSWLNDNDVDKFVIIDDIRALFVGSGLYNNLFITDDNTGLVWSIAKKIIAYFNEAANENKKD